MFKTAALAGVSAARQKLAFSVTERGHKYDAERAEILSRAAAELHELAFRQGGVGYKDEAGKLHVGNVLDGLRFNPGISLDHLLLAQPMWAHRYYDYVQRQHEKGENAYNPMGGAMTPSKHERGGTAWFSGKPEPKKDEKK